MTAEQMVIADQADECVALRAELVTVRLVLSAALDLIKDSADQQRALDRQLAALREEIRRYTASKFAQ